MTSKNSFKTLLEKVFDESLESSKFMNKIINNVTLMATETKKIAELLMRMNDRINQHEKIILMLLDAQNEKDKKEKIVDYVMKPKEGSSKPN